ncbi:MAG: SDR family NAD(P)-dependent oxidoreductase, partial [Nocardioides sp.]
MNRVVLVTGAARGIGAATVRTLVARGDRVVAVDELDMTDTKDVSDQVTSCIADVRDRAALAAAVDLALEKWGRLDAAVAAAAVIAGGRPLWESPDAALVLLWAVAVDGVWYSAAATLP